MSSVSGSGTPSAPTSASYYLSSSSSSTNTSAEDLWNSSNTSSEVTTPLSGTSPGNEGMSKLPSRTEQMNSSLRISPSMGTSPSSLGSSPVEKKTNEIGLKAIVFPVEESKYWVKAREEENDLTYSQIEFSYKKVLKSCLKRLQKNIQSIIEADCVFQRINYIEIPRIKDNKKTKTSDKHNVDNRIHTIAKTKIDMKPATQIFVSLISEAFKPLFEKMNTTDLPRESIQKEFEVMKKSDDAYLKFLQEHPEKFKDTVSLENIIKEREKLLKSDPIKPFLRHFDDCQSKLILSDFLVGALAPYNYFKILNDNLPNADEISVEDTKDLETRVRELLVDHIEDHKKIKSETSSAVNKKKGEVCKIATNQMLDLSLFG